MWDSQTPVHCHWRRTLVVSGSSRGVSLTRRTAAEADTCSSAMGPDHGRCWPLLLPLIYPDSPHRNTCEERHWSKTAFKKANEMDGAKGESVPFSKKNYYLRLMSKPFVEWDYWVTLLKQYFLFVQPDMSPKSQSFKQLKKNY